MHTTDDQQELFIVVDENDRVIGYRKRGECHRDKTLIHRGVNLVVYNDRGEMLLQQRSLTKDSDPGLWANAVGGHVAKGESYKEAMVREAKEELGIDIKPTVLKKFLFRFPKQTEMEALFTAIYNGPFQPNPEEVSQIAFFNKKRLKDENIKLTTLASHILNLVKFMN